MPSDRPMMNCRGKSLADSDGVNRAENPRYCPTIVARVGSIEWSPTARSFSFMRWSSSSRLPACHPPLCASSVVAFQTLIRGRESPTGVQHCRPIDPSRPISWSRYCRCRPALTRSRSAWAIISTSIGKSTLQRQPNCFSAAAGSPMRTSTSAGQK